MQQAKLQGMSIRRMARELGIHRDTVRRYIDAESPPTGRSPATLRHQHLIPSQTNQRTFLLNFDSRYSVIFHPRGPLYLHPIQVPGSAP